MLFNNAFCQLKVDNLGHVGLGTNYPNSGYRLHVRGNILMTNSPDVPNYQLQLKVGEKDGGVIGCTSGYMDFYTSYSGYNRLVARQFITHSQWDKASSEIPDGLEIITGLNPYYTSNEKATDVTIEKGEYVLGPDELLNLVPSAIRVDDDGYGIDYIQIIPLLVAAVQEQQSVIEKLTQKVKMLEGFNSVPINEEENENDGNILYQNKPNPTNTATIIDCYLKENHHDASIVVNDMNGSLVQEIPVKNQGINSVTVEADALKPGVYSYSLTIGGKTVCSKKMVITSKQ